MRTTATVLALQAGLTVILSLIAGWLAGDLQGKMAFSVLVGGGICMITSLLYGLRVFAGGGSAHEVLKRFYRGEFQKLLLTGVLFYVVIRWVDVEFLGVMLGFIVSLISFWIALLLSGVGDPEATEDRTSSVK